MALMDPVFLYDENTFQNTQAEDTNSLPLDIPCHQLFCFQSLMRVLGKSGSAKHRCRLCSSVCRIYVNFVFEFAVTIISVTHYWMWIGKLFHYFTCKQTRGPKSVLIRMLTLPVFGTVIPESNYRCVLVVFHQLASQR